MIRIYRIATQYSTYDHKGVCECGHKEFLFKGDTTLILEGIKWYICEHCSVPLFEGPNANMAIVMGRHSITYLEAVGKVENEEQAK